MIKKKHLHLCISAHLFAKFNQDLAKQGPMLSWVNMFSPLVVVYTANNAEQKLSLRTVFCVAIRHNEYFPQIISSCVVYRCPSICWLLSKDIVPQILASVGNISLFFKSNVWNVSFYNRKRLCGEAMKPHSNRQLFILGAQITCLSWFTGQWLLTLVVACHWTEYTEIIAVYYCQRTADMQLKRNNSSHDYLMR